MELTIEHLAPYLPYHLKCMYSDGKITTIDPLCTETDHNENINPVFHCFGEHKCKPILRPLSDLTKKIKHKGEEFVPAEILFRIGVDGRANPMSKNDFDYQGEFKYKWTEEDCVKVLTIYPFEDERWEKMEVGFYEGAVNFYKGLMYDDKSLLYGCLEQQKLFQFLYKCKFDTRLPEGTWVDVNTLEANCYE